MDISPPGLVGSAAVDERRGRTVFFSSRVCLSGLSLVLTRGLVDCEGWSKNVLPRSLLVSLLRLELGAVFEGTKSSDATRFASFFPAASIPFDDHAFDEVCKISPVIILHPRSELGLRG